MPKFDSLDKLVEFFETHDLGEYWESMPQVDFKIDIKRKTHLVSLDDDLAEKVSAIAKAKHTSSKQLINEWVREKVKEQ